MDQLPNWQEMKCACGAKPVRFTQDLQEVPSEGVFRKKVALQNWRAHCLDHPVPSRTFYLDGIVRTR